MQVVGVFNRDGGTFRTTDMAAFTATARRIFAAHGHSLETRIVDGTSLLTELERAAGQGQALLVGGGDGTVSAAAGVAFRSGVPLAVLPAGTMNLFARSLGVPLDLQAALESLASGTVGEVDIATANGRPFVHQFSVGIHPKLVRLRQSLNYKSRIGKMLASLRAAIMAVARPPNFTAEILTERGLERRRMAGLSVSNNPLGEGHLPHADALDRGVLGIYVVKPLTWWVLAKLAFGLLCGRFRSLPDIIDRQARAATIRFPHRKSDGLAVIDGELIALPSRIDLAIHPRALRVLLPATETTLPSSGKLAAV
ncbi:MAG TPA: diacylglycerol kinase family protein [Hyphomicrobiaceae bacterium]|nr:diacylglycerol kinase family protein [Hyphomicrobiaceae bacterium]